MITKRLLFFLAFFSLTLAACAKVKLNVRPGAMQTQLYFPLLKGQRVGIVANQTSLMGKIHLVDSLKSAGFDIKCVFAPEHGFRGNKSAGELFKDSIDTKTGIRIISLYGKKHGPSKEDLKNIDVLLFDIQDVGVRFYTYISTLQYCMEACAEGNVPLIVLDRPNPHGFYVDGPVLNEKYSSFVGMQPVPVVYGMTIGEYGKMLNEEGWLRKKVKCKLTVVPIWNYFHRAEYGLPVAPSPNLPDMDAIYLYPSVCFFEGTRVSLGRGTDKPFRLIGFPEYDTSGVSFTPRDITGVAANPPFEDTLCYGMDLSGKGRQILKIQGINLEWLLTMYNAHPDKAKFFIPFFDKLAGSDELRKQITDGKTQEEIKASWKEGIDKFKIIRKKYLLYTDFE